MLRQLWKRYYKFKFKDSYDSKFENATMLSNSIAAFTKGGLVNSRNENGNLIREVGRSVVRKSDQRHPLVIKYSR